MDVIAAGLLICCCLILFLQDWRHRKIHVILPLLIFLLSIYLAKQPIGIFMSIIIQNSCFLCAIFGFLVLYMSIRKKKYLNPFENYFGLGDLLFYLAITPLFMLRNYIIFFIGSMIFAVVLQMSLKKISASETVPLAGFSSLFLLLIIAKDFMMDFQKITLL